MKRRAPLIDIDIELLAFAIIFALAVVNLCLRIP